MVSQLDIIERLQLADRSLGSQTLFGEAAKLLAEQTLVMRGLADEVDRLDRVIARAAMLLPGDPMLAQILLRSVDEDRKDG